LRFTANALSIGTPSFNTINIYSNQSDRSIIIEGVLQPGTEASVYDLLGRQVMQQELDASVNKNVMDADQLSSGVYIVELENGNQKVSQKTVLK
jgi:hypothetical protein